MKKAYIKPYLAVESFQLDAAIAAACSTDGYKPIGYSENDCGYETGIDQKYMFFNWDNCDVDLTQGSLSGNDTTCYHGPILAGVTFINS